MYLIKLRPFVSFQFINPDVTNAGNVFQVETGKFFADYDCNIKVETYHWLCSQPKTSKWAPVVQPIIVHLWFYTCCSLRDCAIIIRRGGGGEKLEGGGIT